MASRAGRPESWLTLTSCHCPAVCLVFGGHSTSVGCQECGHTFLGSPASPVNGTAQDGPNDLQRTFLLRERGGSMGTGIQARWLLGEVPWAALESSCRDIQGQAHIPLWGGPCHLLPGRAAPCGLGLETAVHSSFTSASTGSWVPLPRTPPTPAFNLAHGHLSLQPCPPPVPRQSQPLL